MSEGLPEVAPLHLNASGFARIRCWMRRVLGLIEQWDSRPCEILGPVQPVWSP